MIPLLSRSKKAMCCWRTLILLCFRPGVPFGCSQSTAANPLAISESTSEEWVNIIDNIRDAVPAGQFDQNPGWIGIQMNLQGLGMVESRSAWTLRSMVTGAQGASVEKAALRSVAVAINLNLNLICEVIWYAVIAAGSSRVYDDTQKGRFRRRRNSWQACTIASFLQLYASFPPLLYSLPRTFITLKSPYLSSFLASVTYFYFIFQTSNMNKYQYIYKHCPLSVDSSTNSLIIIKDWVIIKFLLIAQLHVNCHESF